MLSMARLLQEMCIHQSLRNSTTLGGVSEISPYTSWTDNPDVARNFAGPDGVILRVKVGAPKAGDSWPWEYSFDEWMEREILLKGIRSGDVEVFLP